MQVNKELETKLEFLTSIEEKAYGLFEFWLANRGKYTDILKEHLRRIKKEAQAKNSSYALGWIYYIFGWLESDQGNFPQSFPYLEAAQEKFLECKDKWALSNTINGFGVNYSHLGTYDKALESYLAALELAEEVQDPQLISSIAINMGIVFMELRQYSDALYYFEEVARDFSHTPSEKAIILCNIGKVYKCLERYQEAQEKLNLAIGLNKGGIAEVYAYQELASIYKLQKEDEQAYKCYKKYLSLARKAKLNTFIASALLNIGNYKKEKGQIDLAGKYLEEALEISEQTKSESLRVHILKSLAGVYKEQGKTAQVYDYLMAVNEYQEKSFNEELVNSIGILKVKQARKEDLIYRDLYDRINTISSIGRTITANLNIEEVGLLVYKQLNELMIADSLLIGIYKEEAHEIDYKIIIKEGQEIKGTKINLSHKKSIERKCLEKEKSLILNNLTKDGEKFENNIIFEQINSLICCPLLLRDKIAGFIMVQSKKKEAYNDYHLDILNALAAYLVIALENGKLFSDVQELATKDSLTNLANRRSIFGQARKVFATSKRYASPLTVIVADLDRFKAVNDTYGHDVGDLVLKTTAKIFLENIRSVDYVGRIGGEEFLFVLPYIELEEAENLSIRLCEILKSQQYKMAKEKFKVTASFGLAEILTSDENIEDIIKRADKALYKAKKLGRARVELGI